MSIHSQADDGTEHQSASSGNSLSATRLEIRAAIAGAFAPHGVHIATDSWSFVQIHRQWLAGHLDLGRRPWMLRPNGDLLAAWARLVTARGAASVALTWVKAHLTPEEALQRGLPEAFR